MNNQAANSTSGVQLIGLLAVVACFGLAATWAINRWTQDAEQAELTESGQPTTDRQVTEPGPQESIAAESVKPDRNTAGIQPSVVLPRQSFAITPDQLEAECEKFIELLLKTLPNNSDALNLAAMYYSRTQQTNKADELWTKSLAISPSNPALYNNWSTNAIQQGHSERALEILDQAERHGVKDPQLLYQRAFALSNLGRDEEVEKLLAPLARSAEMTGSLWMQLGLSQSQLGKYELARDSLLKARELGINNRPVLNGLVNCSARLKDRQAAETYRSELMAIKENVTEFGQEQYEARSESRIRSFSLSIMGEGVEVYRLAGRLQYAELAALRVLAIEPNSLDASNLLLQIYVDKKEPHNQYAVLERLIDLQPGYLLNYLLMARAASLAGNQAQAEGLIKLTIASSPEDATSWSAMAEFLLEQNRSAEAVWYIEQAIDRSPSREAYQLLASALRASGQTDRAAAAEAKVQELTRIPTIRAQAPNLKGP
jgi:Flp pilus assembly protein TadD